MDSQPSSKPDHDDRRRRFVQHYTQHENRVRRYILSLLPDWPAADEIMADTNIRLWEQFDEYDSNKDFGSWACTIAHYLVLARRKEVARQRRVLSDSTIEVVAEYASQAAEPSDRRMSALRHCLNKLSAANRSLIEQVYYGSKTTVQIASSLGQSAETVARRVSRVRMKLHKCIEGQLATEGNR
jgi:RNA polymerase sigma-70 factor (ECF subfamily)